MSATLWTILNVTSILFIVFFIIKSYRKYRLSHINKPLIRRLFLPNPKNDLLVRNLVIGVCGLALIYFLI